jgi:hypothetical protein
MKKELKLGASLLNVTGGVLLLSSFFTKDSSHAVNMRWGALASFGLAWGINIYVQPKTS